MHVSPVCLKRWCIVAKRFDELEEATWCGGIASAKATLWTYRRCSGLPQELPYRPYVQCCHQRSRIGHHGSGLWTAARVIIRAAEMIIYAAELQDIVSRRGILFHGFADDSQLSKSMSVSDIQTGISEQCSVALQTSKFGAGTVD